MAHTGDYIASTDTDCSASALITKHHIPSTDKAEVHNVIPS